MSAQTDELRVRFREKCPDLSAIAQTQIHKLLWLLDRELDTHAENGNLRMNMVPLNSFVAKMLRTKGVQYKGYPLPPIKVASHYFNRREGVTFDRNGTVWFCGWAGGNNPEPFIKAFSQWLDEL